MAKDTDRAHTKGQSGTKKKLGDRTGGDVVQQAQEHGGGSKASKGPVTDEDKRNQNSSAKS